MEDFYLERRLRIFTDSDPITFAYKTSYDVPSIHNLHIHHNYELYFYNGDTEGIASYIASNADLSAFFVDQRAVMAKTLQKNVMSMSGDSYNCTIIHNTDRAYVG